MNRKIRILFFIPILSLLINCSFDSKTGIWNSEERRISELELEQRKNREIIKFYSSETISLKEIAATKVVTLTKPIRNSTWEMEGLNLQNLLGNIYLTGISNNFLKKKIGKNKFQISKLIAPPIFYDENIIFSDDIGTIFSVNKSGRIIWKRNIYKKIYKKIYKSLSFSVYKNSIYVADNVGFIYSLDASTGEVIWIKNHRIPIKSDLKVSENKIFIINQDNRLLCLNTNDGSMNWDFRAISSFIKSQSFLSLSISEDGYLIMLTSTGDLLKLDTNNGQMFWSLNIVSSSDFFETDFFSSSNVVLSEEDVIFSTSSSIFSFNAESSFFNWKNELSSKNTPIIDGNNVFIVTDNGYYLNMDKKTGKIIWSTNILKVLKKKKQNTMVSGFVLGSGKIYATTVNGYLIVCSASSGKVESFKKIGDKITTSPIISDGSLYVLTDSSRIFGFN